MTISSLRTLAGNLGLLLMSTVVALLLAEGATRIWYPIYDGRHNVTEDGEPISGWTPPGTVYYQVAAEFNVRTTITDAGHRVPSVADQPDEIFLGDSNTFGWGLTDDETFVSVYCSASGVSCANLGVPGTGTSQQLDRLERFLAERSWRPKRVNLMMFAMTSRLAPGNDLTDNYALSQSTGQTPGRRWSERVDPADGRVDDRPGSPDSTVAQRLRRAYDDAESNDGLLGWIAARRGALMGRSNLLRIVKYHWGPYVKGMLAPEPDRDRLTRALEITRAELERFREIQTEHGFEAVVYLLHPLEDITRGTYGETIDLVSGISPFPVKSLGPRFAEGPGGLFYPYDGHPNSRGSRVIAEFLMEEARPLDRSEPNG